MLLITIGWGLILLGLFAIISGIVGLSRFPDFYTKLHAASVIDCCGAPLTLIGLACLQDNIINSLKLLFAVMLILLLNPVATNALGRAALFARLPQAIKFAKNKNTK